MSVFDGLDTATVPDSPKASGVFDGLDATPEDQHIDELAKDPTYSPVAQASQYPADHPDYQLAYKVHQARQESGIDPTEPSLIEKGKGALSGLGKFGAGAPLAVGNAAAGLYDAATGDDAGAAKHGTMGAVALQNAEQGVTGFMGLGGRALNKLANLWSGSDSTVQDPDTGEVYDLSSDVKKQVKENVSKADFAGKVQTYKTQSGLAQGQVQNEGLLSGITHAVSGSNPSDVFASPSDLSSVGKPLTGFDKYSMEAQGSIANPANLAFEGAPSIPGVATGLKAVGKLGQSIGDAGASILKSPVAKTAAASAAGGTIALGTIEAIRGGRDLEQHPLETIGAATGLGLLIAARKFSPVIYDAGKMAAGEALPETLGAASIRLRQATAGAAGGAAMGAGLGELSDDQDATVGALSGALLGGALGGLASPRPQMQANAAKAMADYGATLKTGTPMDAVHDATMSNFSQSDQDAINRLRAHLYNGANPTNLMVVDGDTFAKVAHNVGGQGTERGVFLKSDPYATSSDGRSIYLNADAVNNMAGGTTDTAGHEMGHAVVDYLQRSGKAADAAGLSQAITDALTPADISKIQSSYGKALGSDQGNPIEENIAEITRKILQGDDISSFSLSKPLSEKISDAAGRFLENWGFSPKASDSEGMKFDTQNVSEAARQMRGALYEQGAAAKEARTKTTPQTKGDQLQTVNQQIAALQGVPARQQPADAPSLQSLLKQKADLERQIAPPKPALPAQPAPPPETAQTQPSAPPSEPAEPANPFENVGIDQGTHDAAKEIFTGPKPVDSSTPTKPTKQMAAWQQKEGEWNDLFEKTLQRAEAGNYDLPTDPRELHQRVVETGLAQPAEGAKPADIQARQDATAAELGAKPTPAAAPKDQGSPDRIVDEPHEGEAEGGTFMITDAETKALKSLGWTDDEIGAMPEHQVNEELKKAPSSDIRSGQESETAPIHEQEKGGTAIATSREENAQGLRVRILPDKEEQAEPIPAVPTQRDIDQKLADTDQASLAKRNRAKGSRDGSKTKEQRGEEIRKEERIKALTEMLPDTGKGLRKVTNPDTGDVSYQGDIDPTNPLHAAILKEQGVDPKSPQARNITDAQELKGNGVVIRDYRAAGHEEDEGTTAEDRDAEYGKSSAQARLAGDPNAKVTKQDKGATPIGTVATKNGIMLRVFDHDKFLGNLKKILDFGKAQGIPTGYEDVPEDQLGHEIAADFQKYTANQKNGYKGNGEPMQSLPENTRIPKPNPDYAPQPVDENRAMALNAAINNQMAKLPRAPKAGATPEVMTKYRAKLNEARGHISTADLNSGYVDYDTGETNAIRAAMEDAGLNDPKQVLKSTISNLHPDLIDGGIAPEGTHNHNVHDNPFGIEPWALTAEGTGNAGIQAAGFMPAEAKPEETAKKPGLSYDGPMGRLGKEAHGFTDQNEGTPSYGGTFYVKGEPTPEAIQTAHDALKERYANQGLASFMPGDAVSQTLTKEDDSIRSVKPDGDSADSVEQIFKSSGINVSGIRQPFMAAFDGDKITGGLMADFDGDMKIDVAVDSDHRSSGIGRSLIESAVRYYAKNLNQLALKSDVDPEDYDLIVLPVSEKMGPLLKSIGFRKNGEEYVISKSDLPDQGLAGFMPPEEPGDKKGLSSDIRSEPFYPALQRVAETKLPNRASGDQMLGTLKNTQGVKKEEMEFMGIPQFLQGKQSVSKQELLDHIKANSVKLDEVVKDSDKHSGYYSEDERWGDTAEYPSFEAAVKDAIKMFGLDRGEAESFAKETESDKPEDAGGDTKFSQYKTPGGTSYKERLLTLPEKSSDSQQSARMEFANEMKAKYGTDGFYPKLTDEEKARYSSLSDAKHAVNFKSSHWDEPNVLAHTREQDFTDTEGKKLRLLEELQSDWHQKGRKEGYGTKEIPDGYSILEKGGEFYTHGPSGEALSVHSTREAAVQSLGNGDSVPDAPFKKEWPLLAFKNSLAHAVADGMDKIGWVTGETAADRFDLSKQVDKIEYGANSEELIAYKDGKQVMRETVPARDLEDHIGKEAAQKISEQLNDKPDEMASLEGDQLKVGGIGMRGFYDDILPKMIGKYVKGMGGKVESSTIRTEPGENDPHHEGDASAEVHSIAITPEMRKAVQAGQALFMPENKASSDSRSAPKSDLSGFGMAKKQELTPAQLLTTVRSHANHDPENPTSDPREAIASILRGGDEGRQEPEASKDFRANRDAEVKRLAEWAQQSGIATRKLPAQWSFSSPNNVGGQEHDVFFDPKSSRWVKITKPSFGYFPEATEGGFGLRVSTPSEYLQKLDGLKELFGTETAIHAVHLDKSGTQPYLIVSQPDIQGEKPDQPTITKHMEESGFQAVGKEDDAAYYRASDNTAVFDAHPGNMTLTPEGKMASFDAIVIHPDGKLKASLQKMAAKPSGSGLSDFKGIMQKIGAEKGDLSAVGAQ